MSPSISVPSNVAARQNHPQLRAVESNLQPAKAAADQHHAHTQHSHTTQVISNILKACVELMAGSDCAMQAKAHMGAHVAQGLLC